MTRYETLFLAIPEMTNYEFGALESAVSKTIQDAKGVMISCERWGKYRLAYPVRRNDYGIYGLVRFEVDQDQKHSLLDAIKTLFTIKYNDTIMRSMTVSLPANQPLTYHRPESLEETPVRDVDTFLKENKMEGLISKKAAPTKVAEDVEEDIEDTEDEVEGTEQYMGDASIAAATPPSEGN